MSTQTTQGRNPANLFRDVQGTVSAVESGDWVTAGLGMANTAMDIVGMASNPLSGFLSAGFSWAIEHVDFLREPFDALLGDPRAISKMSESWKSAGTQVASVASDYRRTSVEQTRNWHGRTADAYRAAAANHSTGLETLSKACAGISSAVAGAGQLVAAVRKIIMDLVADAVAKMVMKIIQWLAASFCTFGAAIGAAIADIVTMACNYAKKLSDFLSKLASSLTKLMNLVKQVSSIAQIAKQVVDAITAMSHKGASGGAGGAGPDSTRPSAGGLGIDQGQVDRLRQEADRGYTNPGSAGGGGAGGGTTGTSGSSGGQVSAPPTVPGTGGHWEPGRWVPDAPAASGGGQVSAPPLVGGSGGGSGGVPGGSVPRSTPTVPGGSPVRPAYLPAASSGDLHTASTHPVSGFSGSLSGGSGGGAGGFSGSIGGFSGGGSGGGAGGGISGGGGGAGGGGAGGGGGPTQPGGATGILPSSTPGHSSLAGGGGGAAGGGGGAPHGGGGGGAAGGGMMGGAPGGGGQGGGGGKDHQRKIRIDGEELMEPPKAAKPVIGE